jgi:hypothetical protein
VEIAAPPRGEEDYANLSMRRACANADIVGSKVDQTSRMTMDTGQPPIHPIGPPPAIYDHAYRGALTVRQGSLAQVEHYCHTMHGIVSPYHALGCSKVDPHSCFLMIPRVEGPVTASIQAQIRRHELAHCNGWPADHPR